MQHRCVIQFNPIGHARSVWLDFVEPDHLLSVTRPEEIPAAVADVDAALAEGYCVAGFLTYEAAAGLDPTLQTGPCGALPLLRFGLYKTFEIHDRFPFSAGSAEIGDWAPSITADQYESAIHTIKDWIARGDTYQVNFTLRLRASFQGDPSAWFHALFHAQQPRYAAFIESGGETICSVSPELFFALNGEDIACRPMKGTARRGLTAEEDEAAAGRLHHSVKNRAENLMIVDMMRNDLGRIAHTGSVCVEELFAVERYPTVLQMTSAVRARTAAGLADILKALYPSCSITGAPKVRTMEIIRELETEPRGIYTGSIGFVMPYHPLTRKPIRTAQFNVAIRTAHIRKADQLVEYGTGGGIVWDSEADREYRECRIKALILNNTPTDFALLETMLWRPVCGIFLHGEHVRRLEKSARYFGYRFDPVAVMNALETHTEALAGASTDKKTPQRHRIRLLLRADGTVHVESAPIQRRRALWRIALDDRPVDPENPFLYHKTTHRTVYDESRARHSGVDDVVLWNRTGEITESCLANLLVRLNGVWFTPPVSAGLLNGTLRSALVRRGRVREKPLHKDDLVAADRVMLINSLRGFIPCVWAEG